MTKQHYLPQFLLKGFSSRTNGKNRYVKVFRKDQEAFEANVTNVGAEYGFYDGGQGCDVDALLTKRETNCARIVQRLKRGFVGETDQSQIVDFVCNLIGRTRNNRDGLAEIIDGYFQNLSQVVSLVQYRDELEERLVDRLIKISNLESNLDMLSPAARKQLVRLVIELRGIDLVSHFKSSIELVRHHLDIGALVKDGQLQALASGLEKRNGWLKDLDWYTVHRPVGSFVLGDVGPIAQMVGSPTLFRPALFTTNVYAIVLPISSQCLLVGTKGSAIPIDVETINRASAELSREFFVACQSTDRELDYHSIIGRQASYKLDSEIDKALRSLPDMLFA